MKEMIKRALLLGVSSILLALSAAAQVKPPDQAVDFKMRSGPRSGMPFVSSEAPIHVIPGKRASEYTAQDWGKLIDSTWGPGQSYFDQLDIFDTFWRLVDEQWAGFPNASVNWDSVGNYYRPKIYSGMSRGRFFALMSRVALSLGEAHSRMSDWVVDTSFTYEGFEYRPGVPLLLLGSLEGSLLGAAVTPLPDSTSLVYRVGPENPLGLEPGDLVLGYEGIKWGTLLQQLMDAGLPVSRWYSTFGSTPESITYMNLLGVSCNWGLFDTIDVVKYASGDTVHLSTVPLGTLTQWVYHSDQVPVPGVPMPKNRFPWGTEAVSWGVVEGTNVGYIYVWDWMTVETQDLFAAAVDSLLHSRGVEGLVLDFRMNLGGYVYGHKGLSKLFNENPTTHHKRALRTDAANHYGFTLYSPYAYTPTDPAVSFVPTTEPFDGPVAVLTGPSCFSAGEWYSFFMRYFPYVRSFGRPTNGGFVGGDYTGQVLPAGWDISLPTSIIYSEEPGEGYMIHKGLQPDEEVWLTRDGVAAGEDDVVTRALEWISEFTHAHDVVLDRTYASPGSDSICITTILTNPLDHDVALTALASPVGGATQDSTVLYNDGLHGDGSSGDTLWGAYLHAPADEAFYEIAIRTEDLTQGTTREYPDIKRFATAGPLTVDSVAYSNVGEGLYTVRPFIRNNGSTATIPSATATLRSNNQWVKSINPNSASLSSLPPGTMKGVSSNFTLQYDVACPGYVDFAVEIKLDRWTYWTDLIQIDVLTGVSDEDIVPEVFALHQNYPNPFNPNTTIRYQLPKQSHVTLNIINILGQQVATLVGGTQAAGKFTTTWDASGMPSGVYFYRLTAGDNVQTRKMVLVK